MNDEDFRNQFEDLSFPYPQWNHRMHVRLAWIYLKACSYAEALDRLRSGIKAYNAKNQVPEAEFSGYNETTTVAFLRIVKSRIDSYGAMFPAEDSESFCDTHPDLLAKTILRLFYSPERRSHPEAKFRFIEPDLCSIPKPECGSNEAR